MCVFWKFSEREREREDQDKYFGCASRVWLVFDRPTYVADLSRLPANGTTATRLSAELLTVKQFTV